MVKKMALRPYNAAIARNSTNSAKTFMVRNRYRALLRTLEKINTEIGHWGFKSASIERQSFSLEWEK